MEKLSDERLRGLSVIYLGMGQHHAEVCDVIADLLSTRKELARLDGRYRDAVKQHNKQLDIALTNCSKTNAELSALQEATRWIPVGERLPEFKDRVFVFMENNYAIIATFYRDHWTNDGGMRVMPEVVTHWIPLPVPPEGDTK